MTTINHISFSRHRWNWRSQKTWRTCAMSISTTSANKFSESASQSTKCADQPTLLNTYRACDTEYSICTRWTRELQSTALHSYWAM